MTSRRRILRRLFEQTAIALEACTEAQAAFEATEPTDSKGRVAAYLTWATCATVYRRALGRYVAAVEAVASGDLAAQLEVSAEVVTP